MARALYMKGNGGKNHNINPKIAAQVSPEKVSGSRLLPLEKHLAIRIHKTCQDFLPMWHPTRRCSLWRMNLFFYFHHYAFLYLVTDDSGPTCGMQILSGQELNPPQGYYYPRLVHTTLCHHKHHIGRAFFMPFSVNSLSYYVGISICMHWLHQFIAFFKIFTFLDSFTWVPPATSGSCPVRVWSPYATLTIATDS